MLQRLCKFIIKAVGWKADYEFRLDDKCIVIAAPHTSNWDFVLALLYLGAIKGKAKFMIKSEVFFFPFGGLLKALGGLPVDRSHGNNMVDKIAAQFREHDHLHLTITPEGTRKKVGKWKRGFYYIAKRAQVPIFIGYVDYKKKAVGFVTKFELTDDISADMIAIKRMYMDFTPKYPEQFSIGNAAD